MEFINAYNLTGLVIGILTFFIIGIFHPIVIKAEYYFGTKSWWAFLIAGVIFITLSIVVKNLIISVLMGVIAFSCFWSIHEIFAQAIRVKKGWFPVNPRRKFYTSRGLKL
jgi:branched-subunit amino acid transport protein